MNLWLFFLLVNLTSIFGQRFSKCSDTFILFRKNKSDLEGRILIPISFTRNNPSVKLTMTYTITERNTSSNGQLGLLRGKDDAMPKIVNGSLIYKVIFPVEVSQIYFHDIIINNQIYCKNPEMNIYARFQRTISLTHTLYLIQGLNVGGEDTWIRNTGRPKPEDIFEQPTTRPSRPESPQGGFGPLSFWSNTGNVQPPNTRPEVVYEQPTPRPRLPPIEETPSPRPRPQPTPAPTVAITSSPEPDHNKCGILPPSPLVAKGQNYSRGDWPWLAAIFYQTDTGNNFFCSGSLISPRFVVTAAHCLLTSIGTMMQKDLIVVILGKHIVLSLTEEKIQFRNVNQYHVHEDFNPTNLYADIAIIELSKEVEYNEYVSPLCILRVSDEFSSIVGQVGTVAGWGRDEHGLPITDTPKKVSVPIISNEQCRISHPQFHNFVNDKNFCGGYRNGSSPCSGDSGGGLALSPGDEGRWFLNGIVSYSLNDGSGKCNTRQYSVFTNAAKFTTWIFDKMST